MRKLPENTLESLMKREHVSCHKRGVWNSIWNDMVTGITHMKYGIGEITGVTTQPPTLKAGQ